MLRAAAPAGGFLMPFASETVGNARSEPANTASANRTEGEQGDLFI